jgi:hypothetical protein
MAKRGVRGDDEDLQKLFDIVFDSDNEVSDLSFSDSDSEEPQAVVQSVSSFESSDGSEDNDECAPAPPKRGRTTTQTKQGEWDWKQIDNNPVIFPFNVYSGVCEDLLDKYKSQPASELLIFLEYMGPLFGQICDKTNAYARKQLNNKDRKELKDDDKWFETTPDEIRAYFALVILMSQMRNSRFQLYWSKNRCLETPIFHETMSRERFTLISRFLHFMDDEEADQHDKLKKIRPIIEHFSSKFFQLYSPYQDIALDESLMKFRGRLSYVQCNRSKRARFGIKFYKICESSSGYCLSFKIYIGDDVTDPTLPASTNVVLNLCAPLLDKGHTLFIDNWYSSPDLFRRQTDRQMS